MTEWKRLDKMKTWLSIETKYAVLDVIESRKIEKDDILNVNNNRRVNVHADSLIKVGQDLTIEIAQNGSWVAGELFEQVCEQFDLEGYDEFIFKALPVKSC